MNASLAYAHANTGLEGENGPEPKGYMQGSVIWRAGGEPSALRVWCVDDTRLHSCVVQMGEHQTHAFRARFRQL